MKKRLLAISAATFSALGLLYYLKPKSIPPGLSQIKIINRTAYIEISTKMRLYFKEKYQVAKTEFRKYRRSISSRSAEYEKAVQEFNKNVKELVDESQSKVLKTYALNKKYFEDSVNYYDFDPELRHFAEEVVDTNLHVSKTQVLGLEETRKILDFYQARLKDYEADCPELEEYMIINTQIEDEIYRKFKVEMEVLTASWETHKESLQDLYDQLRSQTYSVMALTENSF